jgi:hypothetical protein
MYRRPLWPQSLNSYDTVSVAVSTRLAIPPGIYLPPVARDWVMSKPFSDAVRRFVLISIPTVPHLETLLLLWRSPDTDWSAEDIAKRLFVTAGQAGALAGDLCAADLLECGGEPPRYRCRREPPSLLALLGEVDQAYSRHLRQVTELIHSNVDRKAARFAQAFTWEKK